MFYLMETNSNKEIMKTWLYLSGLKVYNFEILCFIFYIYVKSISIHERNEKMSHLKKRRFPFSSTNAILKKSAIQGHQPKIQIQLYIWKSEMYVKITGNTK